MQTHNSIPQGDTTWHSRSTRGMPKEMSKNMFTTYCVLLLKSDCDTQLPEFPLLSQNVALASDPEQIRTDGSLMVPGQGSTMDVEGPSYTFFNLFRSGASGVWRSIVILEDEFSSRAFIAQRPAAVMQCPDRARSVYGFPRLEKVCQNVTLPHPRKLGSLRHCHCILLRR